MSRWLCVALLCAAACGDGAGSSDLDMAPGDAFADAAVTDLEGDGPDPVAADVPGPCRDVPVVVDVDADITEDTTWCAEAVYRLRRPIFVGSGDPAMPAVLTIRPGTRIEGGTGGASGENTLIITTSGRIEAAGTAAAPIVFTSGHSEADARPGDWGGLLLLGLAATYIGAMGDDDWTAGWTAYPAVGR